MSRRSSTALSLVVWLAASAGAVLVTLALGPVAGLLAGIGGGVVFGLVAARRFDAKRVRTRLRRSRDAPTADGA